MGEPPSKPEPMTGGVDKARVMHRDRPTLVAHVNNESFANAHCSHHVMAASGTGSGRLRKSFGDWREVREWARRSDSWSVGECEQTGWSGGPRAWCGSVSSGPQAMQWSPTPATFQRVFELRTQNPHGPVSAGRRQRQRGCLLVLLRLCRVPAAPGRGVRPLRDVEFGGERPRSEVSTALDPLLDHPGAGGSGLSLSEWRRSSIPVRLEAISAQ